MTRTVVALGLLAMMGCNGEATLPDTTGPGPTGQVSINATSTTDFRYFNLATGSEVTVVDPRSSTAWDIAIRRYEVRLNGGVAGTKGVTGVRVLDNSTLAASTLLGYTPASQLASFDGITAASIPAASGFTSTDLAETLTAWFRAVNATTIVAAPSAAWKVRRADGGYAVVRVAELTLNGFSLASLRLEYRLQPAAGVLGAVQSVTVPAGASGAPGKVLLTTGSTVTTSGCTWDFAITSAITLAVNPDASCPTGTYPLESTESFTTMTSASDAPNYGRFVSALSSPIPNGFTADVKPPFLYGIDPVNQNRLTPTFNIYLVRSGSSTYKLQFLSFYDPTTGESGRVTLRYARVQ
ncbi:MAG: HmuY family protein [Gemmatimonadetes bacterium]|nr:HmuY family protein [Gemmatimonadota bacterium]